MRENKKWGKTRTELGKQEKKNKGKEVESEVK